MLMFGRESNAKCSLLKCSQFVSMIMCSVTGLSECAMLYLGVGQVVSLLLCRGTAFVWECG